MATTIHIVDHVQDMRTPPWLYRHACKIVNGSEDSPFDLDAFSSAENALCDAYLTEADDALVKPWSSRTFCNSPFAIMSRVIDKAIEESMVNGVHVGLIGPSGCCQKWFHKLLVHADVWVPDRRINFLMPDGTPSSRAMADTAFYHVYRCHRPNPVVRVMPVRALEAAGFAAWVAA